MVRIIKANHKTPYYPTLAANMRGADRLEAWAATGTTPAAALYLSMYCSKEMYLALNEDDDPLCAFGVCPANGINLIWLVGTDKLEGHKRDLLVFSREWLGSMVDKYGRLENIVDIRNRKSIRWLKWLGFTFSDIPTEAGEYGEPFYHFWIEKGGNAFCV